VRLVLVGFCPAYYQPATEEFFIVQFLHGAFRFFDGLHLHKCETFRTLVMTIAYDFGILHVPHARKQFKEIALGGVERQIPNVQAGRRNLDSFRLARRSRRLRTIARLYWRFLFLPAVSEKFGNSLPECLFLRLACLLAVLKSFVVSPAPAATVRAA